MLDNAFPALFTALIEHYGRPATPLGREAFLATAASVLAGDVKPKSVVGARAALAAADLLDPQTLAEADPTSVANALRESGFPLPRKAVGTLQRLARWLERFEGDEAALDACPTASLREQLAAINGVGRTTADALLLYALRRPSYPLDRATYRIFVRHGWVEPSADYDEARAVAERPLSDDPEGLAGFASLAEQVGREFCRVSAPRCERCPLRPWLPEGGAIDPSA